MATTESFELKIYTPAGLVLKEQVTAVNLPSTNGEIGILPHHTSYTGTVGTGVLQFTTVGSNQAQRMVVSGGFCTFTDHSLVVLADSVDTPTGINRDTYAAKRQELTKAIESGTSYEPEWHLAKENLARIEAIDRLLAQ